MATLTANGDWFRKIAAMDHQRIEWRPVLDYPGDALAREARGADLVVIGQTKGPGDAFGSLDPGEALLKIGRPTLVVPNGVSSLRTKHVVIGWKDTREARRATQDALPFLHEATRVTVVEICEFRRGERRAEADRRGGALFDAAPDQRQFPRVFSNSTDLARPSWSSLRKRTAPTYL